MITELDRLRKKANQSNYGSKYASLSELVFVIDLCDQLRIERDRLLDERRSMCGFDLAQMWAELQQARAELETIRKWNISAGI